MPLRAILQDDRNLRITWAVAERGLRIICASSSTIADQTFRIEGKNQRNKNRKICETRKTLKKSDKTKKIKKIRI